MDGGEEQYDVAIVGAGLAGLATALSLDSRLKAAVFCKGNKPGGASGWAQGGLAAAITSSDSIDNHVQDTLNAGRGLCDGQVVREIVSDGPMAVDWLESMGVEFSRLIGGKLDLGKEGGHGARRIVHATDATGAAILDALTARLSGRKNITLRTNQVAVDLMVDAGEAKGFYSLDRTNGKVSTISAGTVVLATGGAGKVYRYTTNPDDSTGDGIAMAWRAGCPVANMEFVQFHPTTLYHPKARALLISEAARGDGAILVDNKGRRFMQDHHEDAELAPRDIVARAIDSEMKSSGSDCVWLDFSAIGEKNIRKRYPSILKRCSELGINILEDRVPVVPSAHYLCGGMMSSTAGKTSIENLYAIGETAHTGLHGANRLASNSLLECISVAIHASRNINGKAQEKRPAGIPPWDDSRVGPAHEEVMVAHNWDEIRRMMWNYVGIVRSDERLERAKRRLGIIAEEVDDHYKRFVISSDFIELRNILLCAQLIVRSALARRESRGLHHNIDCTNLSDKAESTVLCKDERVAESIAERALHAN